MGGGDARKTAEGRLFVGGAWREEREWPLARTAYTPYYLHADGTLVAETPTATATADDVLVRSRATRCRRSAATSRPKAC